MAGSIENLWLSAEFLSVNYPKLKRAVSPKVTPTPGAQFPLNYWMIRVFEDSAPLPQGGTTLKGHPSSRAAQVFSATSLSFYSSLNPNLLPLLAHIRVGSKATHQYNYCTQYKSFLESISQGQLVQKAYGMHAHVR